MASKRNLRIQISITADDAEALDWLAYLRRTTAAAVAYELLQPAIAAELAKPGNNGGAYEVWRTRRA